MNSTLQWKLMPHSSWANGGPHAPHMILLECYHLVQGALILAMLPENKNGDSLLISAISQNGRLKIWDFQYLGNCFM